jgi:hypothetical protein
MELKKLILLLAVLAIPARAQTAPGYAEVNVSCCANPGFTTTALITKFNITLTGSVSSSTFTSAAAGIIVMKICENSSGGFTFAYPSSFSGFPAINTSANQCNEMVGAYDGTTVYPANNLVPLVVGLTIASGKTFVVNNTLTLNGTDSTSFTFPSTGGGTVVTTSDTGTVATAMVAANAITSAKEAVVNTRRVCDIAIGDASGSAITNAQLGPQKRMCYIPAAATIVEMDVAGDAGTPNVIVGKNHAGTISNIVSSALATASSGGIACSNTGGTTGIDGATTCSSTLQNTSLAAGDYLDLVSGTAGGTAKLMTIHVIYTIN